MRNPLALVLFSAGLASTVLAQKLEIPVKNWTVPPLGLSTFGEPSPDNSPTPPRAFVAVPPCRVVDTRNAVGPFGGPALATNVARTFDIDSGPCPGVPGGVEAYSLNFGAILPPADGYLTAWPAGSPQPVVSQLNFLAGEVVANAAIVPAGVGEAISVVVNIGPTNVYIDINGYFGDFLTDVTDYFFLVNNTPGWTTAAFHNQAGTPGSSAVRGYVGAIFGAPSYRPAGLRGEGLEVGVLGISKREGVSGSLLDAAGSELAYGILGFTPDGFYEYGVYGSTNFGRGVFGKAGTALGDIGVLGVDGSASPPGYITTSVGVVGASSAGHGVDGFSRTSHGVFGARVTTEFEIESAGYLGHTATTGVYSIGNIQVVAGTKQFVEPHPTDPTKEIAYVSLEGPEAGTYFRGKGRFQRGLAVIELPEDFRMVTDTEGLSVQVTPLGDMASVGVVSIDLERIVVKGSRDVAFFYTVNGVRRAYKDHRPIRENTHYVPETADVRMPLAYSPEERSRLIATGIYNEDGTVNRETATRLGWDKVWEQRSRPAPQAADP
jgi:hypothetical protein